MRCIVIYQEISGRHSCAIPAALAAVVVGYPGNIFHDPVHAHLHLIARTHPGEKST